MSVDKKKNDLECKHGHYCDLHDNVCQETDFPEHCLMREADIEDMKLLKAVKERKERDKALES